MSEEARQSHSRLRERSRRAIAAILLFATLTLVAMAAMNFAQRARYVRVSDGVEWDVSPEGILASLVYFGGPANRAGIRAGDILLSINGDPVDSVTDVIRHLFLAQAGSELSYELQRPGSHESIRVVDVTLVPVPEFDPFSLRGFLEFVGVLYLGIGLFVLIKRWTAPHALHFYIFCLTSFVVYSFSYTGRLNTFDWAVYWSDSVALLLQPAIFLHFALSFPSARPLFRRRPSLFGFVYLSAVVLLVVEVLAMGAGEVEPDIGFLEKLELAHNAHVAVLFLLAAGVFEYTYRTCKDPTLIQQMKWITRGTWMAILPFTTLYVLPLFLDQPPSDWMKTSALSLVFIPLTFGYAIIRYRLMDVDLIFRRGVAYTLATAGVAGAYFGVVVLIAERFHTDFSLGAGGVIIAIIFAAIFFPPLKDWTESRLERLFYRDRYDYRQTMEDFARDLAREIDLDRLLESLLDRLVATLPVQRIAVLLAEESGSQVFRLARGVGGFPRDFRLDMSPVITAARSFYVFTDAHQPVPQMDASAQSELDSLGLNYFIPCRVKERTVGILGLSKTLEGSLLTSDDLELTGTIAHHLAVAMENAQLYHDLEVKADQISRLKDFSDSILESSTVGLVALSEEGSIESWNGTMQRLTGVDRTRALASSLEGVFPERLVREISARQQRTDMSTIYKTELQVPGSDPLLVNVSITPLLSKEGRPVGRLLILDDITERVKMEQQLLQTEKLTSLGLLAAGVAHEVNTPLAVISNYAQMLAKQFEISGKPRELVDKIVKQTFRASEIVSGLLNFSRTGTGSFENSDLNRAIRETFSLLDHQLKEHGIEVTLDLDDNLSPISGDAGRLQQVFLNLLLNARDAMPKGGKIRISSRMQEGRVRIEVADTGYGIPKEDLDKIFDPFFTTKATGQGTGLGLAVSYGIVKEHHGNIHAESNSGKGTRFVLDFPVLAGVTVNQRSANG